MYILLSQKILTLKQQSINKKIEYQTYCQCGTIKHKTSKMCNICSKKNRIGHIRKFNPAKQQLQSKLKQFDWNFTKAGQYYGVNGNSIKKRCKLLFLENPKKRKTGNTQFNPTPQQLALIMQQNGWNASSVARKYCISNSTVLLKCRNHNIMIPDMKPSFQKIIQKIKQLKLRKNVAKYFGVDQRTLRAWMAQYRLKNKHLN